MTAPGSASPAPIGRVVDCSSPFVGRAEPLASEPPSSHAPYSSAGIPDVAPLDLFSRTDRSFRRHATKIVPDPGNSLQLSRSLAFPAGCILLLATRSQE